MRPPLERLYSQLGYTFTSPDLLEQALTHRSRGAQNNERLEFLGDAILGYVIAEALFYKHPQQNEGTLSRLRAALVKGDTLAEIAREFTLGDYLNLGPGELKSGGHRRASILADAVEAIIGAISLDADFATAKTCVLNWYQSRIDELTTESLKDPKTRLQEFLQSRKQPLPEYQVTDIKGQEHNQTFTVECKISLYDEPAIGKGSSRRTAEQKAARQLLEKLNNE